MKITLKFLENKNACQEGIDWAIKNNLIGLDGASVVKKLIKQDKLDWANWLIVRVMKRKQQIQYAIYAAEQVLDIFEKEYPDDKRPREAIGAAKKVLKNDTKENREAAASVAFVASAASIDEQEMKIKILNYGIKLLTKKV